MSFYDGVNTIMSCALKVDTSRRGWHEVTSEILKKIRGVSYHFDAKEGTLSISGNVNPRKILRNIAKYPKSVELCWIKIGDQYVNEENEEDQENMAIPSYPCMEPRCHRGLCLAPPMAYRNYHNYYPPMSPHYHYPPPMFRRY